MRVVAAAWRQSNVTHGCPMTNKTMVSGIDQLRKSRVEVRSSDRGVFFFGLKATVLRLLALFMFIGLTADSFLAATATSKPAHSTSVQESGTAAAEPQEHGLSAKPVEIARPFNFPITNSMLVSWMVAIGLIVFAQFATRKMRQVPTGAQNFLEWLVEALYRFLVGIIGPHLAERTFWFFATIFIFVLASNWFGLIPGIGSVGWGHYTAHGFRIDQPLFRGANADVNMTLAMALVFFAAWIVWALREVGVRGFLKELFAPKGESEGVLRVLLVVVFFAAGCLEVVSILFRPISLSFRLYGNIFAGENLLEAMATLVPGFGWLVAIPFYFLELVMGLVQALVFMLLTAVFTMLMCQHEAEAPLATHV
jgi:F-type H+-transporting ATPase subunit a